MSSRKNHNIKRRVYRDNDDYTVRLEECDGVLFIHIVLKKASVSIIKHLKQEFELFKKKIRDTKSVKFDHIFSYSKEPKFYRMFKGCEYVGEMTWEGEKYEVLKWDLNS